MADISAEKIQKLRAITGAGLMDCKRALQETDGDMDKAVKILREKGAATAAKRAEKATGAGLVTYQYAPDGKTAVLVELNCETDFVADTDEFKNLLKELAQNALKLGWNSPADAPQDKILALIAKLGENIKLRRLVRYDAQGHSIYGVYIHPSGEMGKIGVLVELAAQKDTSLSKEEVKAVARDIAMQVAAASPKFIARTEVAPEVLESEKSIAREQAKKENKPEKIWDKIAEGKLNQYFQMFCLLDQPYVKEPGGKTPVGQYLKKVSQQVGDELNVKRFARFNVSEQ